MRKFGKVPISFWSGKMRKASPTSRLVAVYLLTCVHANLLGVFRIPVEYLIADLNLKRSEILKSIDELKKFLFLYYDVETGWIIIWDFLKWNTPQNPNVIRHLHDLVADLEEEFPEDSKIKQEFDRFIKEYAETLEY